MPDDPGAGADPAGAGRRPRARRGQGDQLREEILAAAGRLLAEGGDVAGLSLRGVAREVGVATTSIYLHFRSLAELVLAVRMRYLEEFEQVMAAAAADAGADPGQRARARCHAYVRYGLANRGRYAAMFAEHNLPPQLVPEAVRSGVQAFLVLREEIAAIVGDGGPATMITVHLWTALHGVVMFRTRRGSFPWPELTEEIDDLCDRLIRA